MIARYTTDEMTKLFSHESRFDYMKKVEINCAVVQAQMGIIPRKAALEIEKKAKFQVNRIFEIEKVTKHDVIAFVSNMAENVGESGKYIHFGLTSSDVLDTALSLQLSDGLELVLKEILRLEKVFKALIKKHAKSLCAGRTHGIYAEVTTFGFKLAGFHQELIRNKNRILKSLEQIRICKLSGAVGTSSALPIEFEQKVAKKLGLRVESFATQVIPRDRHAEVVTSLSFLMSGYERLAVELRHLQRSEVSEVIEGFTAGQKGSSAMPHKKNPISAENLTGLSRLVRGDLLSAFENIPLWHERDISHSSVERVIFPDIFQLSHYATRRLSELLTNLYIDTDRMFQNAQALGGVLFSSHLLLHLVEKHEMSRESAYVLVQRLAHSLKTNEHLKVKILQDAEAKKYFSKQDIEKIFSGRKHIEAIQKRIKTYFKDQA